MTNERSHDEDQSGENDQDGIQTHALYFLRDGAGDRMQEARGGDGLAEREAAGGEDDDGPEEIVEVLFGQDSRAEKEDERDDGHDAHVSKDVFELVRHAPQDYGHDGDDADEPLNPGEFVFHGPDRHDGGTLSGLEGDQEEYPDEEYRRNADGEGDEEPDPPARLRPHVFKGDDVLWRSDGGGSAANVRGKRDTQDEGFGEIRI